MAFIDAFYDKENEPRVPAVIAAGAGALWMGYMALFGYPNSLRDRTVEKVAAEVEALNSDAYLLDNSVKFELNGRSRSTTDGKATLVVLGQTCRIKFDTTPDGIVVYPSASDKACAPHLPKQ